MMEERPSSSSKKRKSAVALPSQKRCLIKKTGIPGSPAGTCALSQSPSKISPTKSPTSSNQIGRIPSTKNAKACPSTSPSVASHRRDLTAPTRMSSRVSCPTFKKKALSAKKPRLSESDGTPPLSIILPTSPKQKRPKSSPTKRLAGNNTPSKRKWLDPSPIELTSSDDDSRPQPPRKRIKRTHKKPFSSVIDLCSESEDVIVSPRHTCTRDEGSVVVLSTDEEVDLEFPVSSQLAFRNIDTRKSLALPQVRDISPPIEIESVFQASPPPLAHSTPVPKPKALVPEEDGVTDETNLCAKKFDLPRGSLQVLYNEALARCTRKPRREKNISDQLSSFPSPRCIPSASIIRYATQTQSPSLHTPLFFSRIILRLRARPKQRKTLDAKAPSDTQASFSNPKVFPDATALSDISNDADLNSMEVSKLNEDHDTFTYPDAVMEISAVDTEALEIATETILKPSIDIQGDTLCDTQGASISPSMFVNNMDVNERLASQSLGSPSPLPIQESLLWPEVTILEDTPIPSLHSIQAQTTNFVQELQRTYDLSNIYDPGISYRFNPEFSVHPALDAVKTSAAFQPLSELPMEYESITNTSSVTISSTVHTSLVYNYLPELSMEQETTLNLSSPAVSCSKDVSSGLECLFESPAIPNLYPLASSSSTDTLSSCSSKESRRSLQSLDSSTSIESVKCHLLTPDDSPSALSPLANAQEQESLICSNPIGVSFGIDMSELNLQTIMFDEDDEDDDISISGMELTYPEDSHI